MICLNVGCHDIQIAGFINIDIDPVMKPDLLWDATKLKEKFIDDTVDFIYCGHFLEHLSIVDGQKVIGDFYSILKPFGSIVTVIPDYTKTSKDLIEEAETVIIAGGQHKSLYDEQRLLKMFKIAKFSAWPIDVKDIPWCRWPQVIWQSAIIGVKHPPVVFPRG
jgi:predicted SAM-dependent methyltransferase